MKKQLRKQDRVQKHALSLVCFADDGTLLARGHNYAELEALLCQTLADWKETVKPQKTKRLMIGRSSRELDHSFADSAKLLGSWFQDTGSYQLEDDKRLERARAVWRSLYFQLPRFGVSVKIKGRVVQAAVVMSSLYSTESRIVPGKTIRKWQTFLNTVARGITGRRLRDMQGQLTMADVRREAGLDSISTYISVGQLRYLGHIARLPSDRLEKILLFSWLPQESTLPASKVAPSTRRHLWQLLKNAMEVSQVDSWEARWMDIASAEGGAVWSRIVHKWQKHLRDSETQLTWQVKHSEAATADRKAAAEQRVFESLGAQPAGDGKYKCPNCSDPPVCMYLRSLRKHVLNVKTFPKKSVTARLLNVQKEKCLHWRHRQDLLRRNLWIQLLHRQCTLHSTLCTLHFPLHTQHFKLYTPHSTLTLPL